MSTTSRLLDKTLMAGKLEEEKSDFEHVTRVACNVKNGAEGSRTDRRGEIADALLLKNILSAITLNQILKPTTHESLPTLNSPDFTSVAVVARSIVETFLAMQNISLWPMSEEESEFRLLWWDWHEICERIRTRDCIRSKLPLTMTFDGKKQEIALKIQNHPKFDLLPKTLLKEFKQKRSPKRPFLEHNRQIALTAGILEEHFDVQYQMLSSIAHSQGLLVRTLSRHDPFTPEVNSVLLASVRCATAYMSFSVLGYSGLFERGRVFLDSRFLEIARFWAELYSTPFPEE